MGKEDVGVELDFCGKSSWSGGVLLASGMERMERAGSGYTAACTGFGVLSLRSSQVGSRRELCSLRGVKSLCDVTLWMLWAEKGKHFFPIKAYMVLYDHGAAGGGWLEAREEMGAPGECHSVASHLLSPVSSHGGELGKVCGGHLPT